MRLDDLRDQFRHGGAVRALFDGEVDVAGRGFVQRAQQQFSEIGRSGGAAVEQGDPPHGPARQHPCG
ncbi:universal stress protein, partial [Corchorus olitorius]